MKDRIKKIMDNENLSAAKFADQLQINRAVISHILNGRNNPSLDVVMKILSEMNYISSDWLLNGVGSMYKEGYSTPIDENERSIFNIGAINLGDGENESEYAKENDFKNTKVIAKQSDIQEVSCNLNNARKVRQIIIYYTDNTFETFTPH